jgi:hypothetical protein
VRMSMNRSMAAGHSRRKVYGNHGACLRQTFAKNLGKNIIRLV